MSGFIPYGRQQISEEDIEAVVRVLRSDYLTQGPAVPAFEQAVARYLKTLISFLPTKQDCLSLLLRSR